MLESIHKLKPEVIPTRPKVPSTRIKLNFESKIKKSIIYIENIIYSSKCRSYAVIFVQKIVFGSAVQRFTLILNERSRRLKLEFQYSFDSFFIRSLVFSIYFRPVNKHVRRYLDVGFIKIVNTQSVTKKTKPQTVIVAECNKDGDCEFKKKKLRHLIAKSCECK